MEAQYATYALHITQLIEHKSLCYGCSRLNVQESIRSDIRGHLYIKDVKDKADRYFKVHLFLKNGRMDFFFSKLSLKFMVLPQNTGLIKIAFETN